MTTNEPAVTEKLRMVIYGSPGLFGPFGLRLVDVDQYPWVSVSILLGEIVDVELQ